MLILDRLGSITFLSFNLLLTCFFSECCVKTVSKSYQKKKKSLLL